MNLKVNKDKTEHIIIKRKQQNTEVWRNIKKVGLLIGYPEDIMRKK